MWRTGKRSALPATGSVGTLQGSITVVMSLSLGIRLFRGCRVRERRQHQASSLDARQRRVRTQIEMDAARVRELRNEADVGKRWRGAMAERAGWRFARQSRPGRLEPDVAPIPIPAVLLRVGRPERAGQVVEHAQVVERVDVARVYDPMIAVQRPAGASLRQS